MQLGGTHRESSFSPTSTRQGLLERQHLRWLTEDPVCCPPPSTIIDNFIDVCNRHGVPEDIIAMHVLFMVKAMKEALQSFGETHRLRQEERLSTYEHNMLSQRQEPPKQMIYLEAPPPSASQANRITQQQPATPPDRAPPPKRKVHPNKQRAEPKVAAAVAVQRAHKAKPAVAATTITTKERMERAAAAQAARNRVGRTWAETLRKQEARVSLASAKKAACNAVQPVSCSEESSNAALPTQAVAATVTMQPLDPSNPADEDFLLRTYAETPDDKVGGPSGSGQAKPKSSSSANHRRAHADVARPTNNKKRQPEAAPPPSTKVPAAADRATAASKTVAHSNNAAVTETPQQMFPVPESVELGPFSGGKGSPRCNEDVSSDDGVVNVSPPSSEGPSPSTITPISRRNAAAQVDTPRCDAGTEAPTGLNSSELVRPPVTPNPKSVHFVESARMVIDSCNDLMKRSAERLRQSVRLTKLNGDGKSEAASSTVNGGGGTSSGRPTPSLTLNLLASPTVKPAVERAIVL